MHPPSDLPPGPDDFAPEAFGPVVTFSPEDGSLGDALWRFPAGAHVMLAPGMYRGANVLPEDIRLEAAKGLGSVTLIGGRGATLSAEGASRVHLVNLVIKGPGQGFGAAVQVYQQCDVLISGCVITAGRGRGEGGGGVDLQAGRVRLRRCRLTHNVALQGGAVRASGVVRLEANNCVFADNRVEGKGGGAIFAAAGASASLLGCTFAGNRGAIGSAVLAAGRMGAEVAMACCLVADSEGGLSIATLDEGQVAIRNSVLPQLAAKVSAGIDVDASVRLRGVGVQRSGKSPFAPSFPVILRGIGQPESFPDGDQADLYGRSRAEVWVGAVA